jgi:hypothetical protein
MLTTNNNEQQLIAIAVEHDYRKRDFLSVTLDELSKLLHYLGFFNRELPRSTRRGRKRPFLMVFDSFGSDCITTVFHGIVNECKRSDPPFLGRLRQYT